MKIPPTQLESTKRRLHHLVDERTSALWASYGDEDISVNEQDREDIEKIQTVADVLEWLQNQGSQKTPGRVGFLFGSARSIRYSGQGISR